MTKEVKHTPGPWEIKDGLVHVPHVTGHGGSYVYPTEAITRRIKTMTGKENNANALLIHAAPDLLSAAQEALDELCLWETTGDADTIRAIDGLRKAVAKARGE